MVIFQHTHLFSGSIKIHVRINSCLDLWNRGPYKNLVQDSYRAAGGGPGRKISGPEKTPLIYVVSVWGNSCFYSGEYYEGWGRVGHTETSRECRARWHGIGSFTGVSTKIWRPQEKILISVESFVEWLANRSPPWDAYRSFMSFSLIALNKLPSVRPVGTRETWHHLFAKYMMKFTGPEDNHASKNDWLCLRFKVGIDVAVHGV